LHACRSTLEDPRHDFAWHRNEALRLAREQLANDGGGVLLFLDADERLVLDCISDCAELLDSDYDGLWAYAEDEEYRYLKLLAARSTSCLYWAGVIHERLIFRKNSVHRIAKKLRLSYGQGGRRRKNPTTISSDIAILHKQQNNYRHLFFLARSYECAGMMNFAEEYFRKANTRARSEDEVFQSLWGLLRCQLQIEDRLENAMLLATDMVKLSSGLRAEPLIALARQALFRGMLDETRILAHAALTCPIPWGSQMYDAGARTWKAYATLAQSWQGKGNNMKSDYYWKKALSCKNLTRRQRKKIVYLMSQNRS
jgi:hypothetical protein